MFPPLQHDFMLIVGVYIGLSQKCGRKLQKRWLSPGGLQRQCTGNSAKGKWHDGPEWFRFPSRAPARTTQSDTEETHLHGGTRIHILEVLPEMQRDMAEVTWEPLFPAEQYPPAVKAFLPALLLCLLMRQTTHQWRN